MSQGLPGFGKRSVLERKERMKKIVLMLAALIATLVVGAVSVVTEGPRYCDRVHDVFAVKYWPAYGFSINDVGFVTDLRLFAREDMGDYWLFLFDVDKSEGFHGVRATLPIDSFHGYNMPLMTPYWDGTPPGLCPVVHTSSKKRRQGTFYSYPTDGSGPSCFGWKVYNVETNFYPLVQYKSGEPFLLLYEGENGSSSVDLGVGTAKGNPQIPEGSMLYYAVVTTNISVRLDVL